MPQKPVPPGDLRAYRLPSLAALRKAGTASGVMKKIIKVDKDAAKMHSTLVIAEACRRYVAALHIAGDPEAYAAFAKEPMITTLKRTLKSPDDTYRAIWQATMGDSKLASKRFKRTEHLWDKRAPVSEIENLLEEYGWEKPIPHVTKPKARKANHDDLANDLEETSGRARGHKLSKSTLNDSLPTVTITGVPKSFKARRDGSFTLSGRVVKQVGGTLTIADAVLA